MQGASGGNGSGPAPDAYVVAGGAVQRARSLDARMAEVAGKLTTAEQKVQRLERSGAARTRAGRAQIAAARAERAALGREMGQLAMQRVQGALEQIPRGRATMVAPPPPPFPPSPGGMPEGAREIGIAFIVCTVATLVLFPMMRAIGRGFERRMTPRPVSTDTSELTRFEQRIDSVALELERIGEAQRYATRVLTSRASG